MSRFKIKRAFNEAENKTTLTFSPQLLLKVKSIKHFLHLLKIDKLIKHRSEVGLYNDDKFIFMNESDYVELWQNILFGRLRQLPRRWRGDEVEEMIFDSYFAPQLNNEIPRYTVIFRPHKIVDDLFAEFSTEVKYLGEKEHFQ